MGKSKDLVTKKNNNNLFSYDQAQLLKKEAILKNLSEVSVVKIPSIVFPGSHCI